MKKSLSLLLVLCLVFSLFAFGGCQKNNDNNQDAKENSTNNEKNNAKDNNKDDAKDNEKNDEPKEAVTITILAKEGQVAGSQSDPVSMKIKELTGIDFEFIVNSESKFKLMLAGNDLPDIFYSNMTTQGMVDYSVLIQGGHVLALDDLIKEHAPNIAAQESKLEYAKMFKSNGQDKIYFLPKSYNKVEEGQKQLVNKNGGIRYYGRWDVYKEIGAPEINSEEDLLNTLKAMQDAYPETPDGKKVYALSGWTDWGLWPFFIPPMYGEGYFYTTQNVYFHRETGEYNYLYLTDEFWNGIAFFNKAFRMGILDPEGFTMKMENYNEKLKAGSVLTCYAHWFASQYNDHYKQAGMEEMAMIPLESGLPYENGLYSGDRPIGGGIDWSTAISANTKHPVEAIKFLDFLHSEQGAILNTRGVEGIHWEKVDGVPSKTAEFIEQTNSNPDYLVDEGIDIFNAYNPWAVDHLCEDGAYLSLNKDESLLIETLTPAEVDFCEYYDVDYPGMLVDRWVQEGRLKTVGTNIWHQLVQAEEDSTKQITASCEQYMRVAVISAIMAKDDDEFEELKQEAIHGMKERGIDEAMAEYTKLFDAAKEAASGFMK